MDWHVQRALACLRGLTLSGMLALSLTGCGALAYDTGDGEDSGASDPGASGDDGSGSTTGDAASGDDGVINDGSPQYLLYGVVYGPATKDCPEGGDMYRDALRWYSKVVSGSSASTYDAAASSLRQQMMKDLPNQRTYSVESSSVVAGDRVSHLVVIEYSQILSGRYCRPWMIVRGYGSSYNSALAQAVLAKDVNGGKNVSYKEIGHVTWTPSPQ